MSSRAGRFKPIGNFDDDVAAPAVSPVIDQDGLPERPVTMASVRARERFAIPAREATSEEIEAICRVLGVPVARDPRKLSAVIGAIDVTREQTLKIVDAGIQVGRALVDAEDELSPEEFRILLRSGRALLSGWSQGNLVKMQGAARFVDSGRVSRDRLPQSYTVLYQLSKLKDDELAYALANRLVHPKLTRVDAEGLRRRPGELSSLPRSSIVSEIEKLDVRIETLTRRLKAMKSRRSELELAASKAS